MQQIKLFIGTEADLETLEGRVNGWLAESGARVVHVFGNIAPQTVTPESKTSPGLSGQRFASSDVFLAIVHEPAS